MSILTRRMPGWLREEGGKAVPIPERQKTVRRIFDLAISGHGVHSIARKLNEDGVPVMGRTTFRGRPVVWNETVVYHVLRSRATFGEYQPTRLGEVDAVRDGVKVRERRRVPDGDPIAGYYPAVIDRELFDVAANALKSRTRHGSGRRGQHINLFSGLLMDARDKGTLTYKHTANRLSVIIPVVAKQGKGTAWTSFPAEPFERAIRSKLVEVSADEIAGDDGAGRKAEALAGRLTELDAL